MGLKVEGQLQRGMIILRSRSLAMEFDWNYDFGGRAIVNKEDTGVGDIGVLLSIYSRDVARAG